MSLQFAVYREREEGERERIRAVCETPSRQRVWQPPPPIRRCRRLLFSESRITTCITIVHDIRTIFVSSRMKTLAANLAKRLGYEVTVSQRSLCYFSPLRSLPSPLRTSSPSILSRYIEEERDRSFFFRYFSWENLNFNRKRTREFN